MIALDTSILVDSFSGPKRSAAALRSAFASGERIALPSLVLYEWLRGPRRVEELEAQEELLPSSEALPFGSDEASLAADLYRMMQRARGRELDLAIAATAIRHRAMIWTLEESDFADIPELDLYSPRSG